ncbi:phosphatase PAP2 family protein [Halosolutus gelatinilyticus]|uniref:phosphatase PAP2 family protein n=1 Tax=Halosolutus gelatinilyticus TaxID=2931975 RepID=UPI001FF43491|nr:phosphatase PAP2 family protein [Halosolutus gelatinilyticus]
MLSQLLLIQAIIVGTLVLLTGIVCGVNPFRLDRTEVRTRIIRIAPIAGFLGLVYLFNRSSHTTGQNLSRLIGVNVTDELRAVEGDFVAHLQAAIPHDLAGYFTFIYLFGFMFVLVFPVVAYFLLPTRRYLTTLFVAYAVNYGIGAICYVVFIAYGPRKTFAHVGQPMYELYPEVSTLTGAVNSSANVFPSLHASLAVTVALLAWLTRDEYPRWTWIATAVTINIVIATMFLGIHWLIDVVAGAVLAVLSILIALRVVPPMEDVDRDPRAALGNRKP